jgi:DNA-binding SARP family transcriptional activator
LAAENSSFIPLGAQRLLALLALEDGTIDRVTATGLLWPDSRQGRAAANFRSALWRAKRVGSVTLIDCVGPRLHLAPSVRVDLHELLRRSRQIGSSRCASGGPDCQAIIDGLSRELLPTWSDDWLVPERARWDQVRLHVLETMAQQFLTAQNYLTALEAALAAVAIEPIRESAHRLVLKVHIAEGNSACAMQHYHRYRGLLQRELSIKPSRQMVELIHPLTGP